MDISVQGRRAKSAEGGIGLCVKFRPDLSHYQVKGETRRLCGGEEMTRRTCSTAIGAALMAGSILTAKEGDAMRELLEASQNEKKSVMLYLKGQNIGGAVVKVAGDTVELRNREYSRIVVRIDAIDAVAMV
jgi:hypothetical protein